MRKKGQIKQLVRIEHISISGMELNLACKGRLRRGILKRDECHLNLKRLPALALITS